MPTLCDIKTIKNNPVNSPLSVFKCSLISEALINLKNHTVCLFCFVLLLLVSLSSLKIFCCTLTRAGFYLFTVMIAKNQLPNTKSILFLCRDCKRAHLKIKLFSDNWIDDISLMQIFFFPVPPACIIMGNLRAGFPSKDLWLFTSCCDVSLRSLWGSPISKVAEEVAVEIVSI